MLCGWIEKGHDRDAELIVLIFDKYYVIKQQIKSIIHQILNKNMYIANKGKSTADTIITIIAIIMTAVSATKINVLIQ